MNGTRLWITWNKMSSKAISGSYKSSKQKVNAYLPTYLHVHLFCIHTHKDKTPLKTLTYQVAYNSFGTGFQSSIQRWYPFQLYETVRIWIDWGSIIEWIRNRIVATSTTISPSTSAVDDRRTLTWTMTCKQPTGRQRIKLLVHMLTMYSIYSLVQGEQTKSVEDSPVKHR